MKQNCWGNDTNCWGSEAKCVGEVPQIQSEITPLVWSGRASLCIWGISPTHIASLPQQYVSFPQQFCFISPTILLHFPNNLLHFPNNMSHFPNHMSHFPNTFSHFPNTILCQFAKKILCCVYQNLHFPIQFWFNFCAIFSHGCHKSKQSLRFTLSSRASMQYKRNSQNKTKIRSMNE